MTSRNSNGNGGSVGKGERVERGGGCVSLASDSERSIEKMLVREVESVLNGWCPKWLGQGAVGVPDRIVFVPDGRVFFVEVKRKTGVVSPMQRRVHQKMRNLGVRVHIIWSKDDVKQFIQAVADLSI